MSETPWPEWKSDRATGAAFAYLQAVLEYAYQVNSLVMRWKLQALQNAGQIWDAVTAFVRDQRRHTEETHEQTLKEIRGALNNTVIRDFGGYESDYLRHLGECVWVAFAALGNHLPDTSKKEATE